MKNFKEGEASSLMRRDLNVNYTKPSHWNQETIDFKGLNDRLIPYSQAFLQQLLAKDDHDFLSLGEVVFMKECVKT